MLFHNEFKCINICFQWMVAMLVIGLMFQCCFESKFDLLVAGNSQNSGDVGGGNCWSKRANLGENDFVPECTDNGNFKPVQCDNKTGYCFCVNEITGRPNSKTTTRNRSPNCKKHVNSMRKPKLSAENGSNRGNGRGRGGRCSSAQRFSFITQLLSVIRSRFDQFKRKRPPVSNPQSSSSSSSSSSAMLMTGYPMGVPMRVRRPVNEAQSTVNTVSDIDNLDDHQRFDTLVVRKFNELDINSDLALSFDEMNRFMVDSSTLFTTLAGCVQSLFDFCDSNRDYSVARAEFLYCLNPRHSLKLDAAWNSRRKQQQHGTLKGRPQLLRVSKTSMASVQSDGASSFRLSPSSSGSIGSPQQQYHNQHQSNYNSQHHQTMTSSMSSNDANTDLDPSSSLSSLYTASSLPLSESLSTTSKNESRLDCLVTRSNLIESARVNPHGLVFIPECTKDGYYVRVQCHLLHCWCVSRVTGQPIKQLNTNATTNVNACNQMRKGCDQRRRVKFHAQLRQQLQRDNLNCDTVFDKIDTNFDHHVDAIEWKQYRKSRWRKSGVINSRLRKCFRTEIHYCDQNGDSLVSRDEWVQCCMDNVTSSAVMGSTSGGGGPSTIVSSSSTIHRFTSMYDQQSPRLYQSSSTTQQQQQHNPNPHHMPPHHQHHYQQPNPNHHQQSNHNNNHQHNSFHSPNSASLAEAYNQKRNRPRFGPNPLKILKSEK